MSAAAVSAAVPISQTGNLVPTGGEYQFRPQGGAGYLRVMQVRPPPALLR